MPRFSDDDVVDYLVREAIGVRASIEIEKEQKAQEEKARHDEFKSKDSIVQALPG